jgi:hypothetical protein
MPRESKITMKDMLLLIEGILIALIVQLFYDSLHEPFFTNLLPLQSWRIILAVVSGIPLLLILNYFRKHVTS